MKKIEIFLNNNLYKFIILFCLILTAFLYIYKIDFLSLDYDELFTINILNLPSLSEVILEGNIKDSHPPLYHVLLFFFVKFFGITEFGIRLFSALCGIFSIFFVFILAKKMFSVNEAIISSFIFFFNTFILQINQIARGYALFLLLSIITFIFFINIIKNIDKDKLFDINLLLYICFSALNIYTHYFAIFLLGNQLLFLLVFYGKKVIKQILFVFIILFVLYLPWIKFIIKPDVLAFGTDYLKWIRNFVFFDYEYYLLLTIFLIIPILSICINKLLKKETYKTIFYNYNKNEVLLLFFAVVPYFILFLICKFWFKCYAERYIVFLVPIYIILISRGITLVFKNFILRCTFISIFFISLSFNLLQYRINSFTELYCDNPRGAIKCMSYIYKLNKNKNITLLFVGIHYFDFYISKYLNNIEKDKIVLLDFRRKNVDRSIMDFLKQRKSEYVLALQSCHTTYLQDNYEIIFQDHFNFYFDVYLIKTKILWNK